MAKKEKPARGRGRPKKADGLRDQINVRVDAELRQAIDAYRTKYRNEFNLEEMADAVRHMLRRVLRDERLL